MTVMRNWAAQGLFPQHWVQDHAPASPAAVHAEFQLWFTAYENEDGSFKWFAKQGNKNPNLMPSNKLVVKEWVQPLCQIAHQEGNVLMVLCFMAWVNTAGVYTESGWSRWQEGFHVVARLHFQFKRQHLAPLKERNKERTSGYSVFQSRKTKTF